MAFRIDENGNITMVQGDTGRLVVNGLNTDQNYTVYFACAIRAFPNNNGYNLNNSDTPNILLYIEW